MQATGPLTRMVALGTNSARQARMLARSGAESAAAAELTAIQDAILAQEPPDLAAMATVAVHRDVMLRRNRNISPDLPALWARLGAFTRAEALAQSINDPGQRAAALEAIATAASLAGSDDAEPADPPQPPTSLAPSRTAAPVTEAQDDPAKHDVQALISAARSIGGADAAALFDMAEATASTAKDPDLRANLWNDIAWARGSAAGWEYSAQPGSALVETYGRFPALDDVVSRAAEMGDLDRAIEIARIVYRADPYPSSGLLLPIVEHVVKARDISRAEQIVLSFPEGLAQTDVLNRLVEMAVEIGAPTSVEHAARALITSEGGPTALVKVARAALDRGDMLALARELLAEALAAMPDPSSWEAKTTFLDAVRTMAEIGDVEEAVSAATARTSGNTRLQALLSVAQGAHDRGEYVRARILAAQVLKDAAAAMPDWLDISDWREAPDWLVTHDLRGVLGDAADLLVKLGGVEQARSVALTLSDPRRQGGVLVRIAETALETGDLVAAEATSDLIMNPSTRDELLPSFIRAYLRVGNHAAAMNATQRVQDAGLPARLVSEAVQQALDEGALDTAALAQAARENDVLVTLRMKTARALLEAAEVAARSTPDPAWRAGALAEAAWALLPGAYIERMGMLTVAAEAAARQIPDAELRVAALVNVAAAMAAAGDPERADGIFQEAARISLIRCACAEQLATRAQAAANRGHRHTAREQVSAIGSLVRWITEPHNRVRAEQAWLAAAIHIGDRGQAETAARAIKHPDQQALALIDLTRALAASGQTEKAITVALTIAIEDRRADALSGVARLAAARGEVGLAERAARAITVRGGQAPALLSVAWEAARAGDLARAEQIVASITDQEWHGLGLYAIHAQRDAPSAVRTLPGSPPATLFRPGAKSVATGAEQQAQDLLCRVDAMPDHPMAARLLAEAMRAGPCVPALASLSRVDPPATLAAADTLLALLR